MSSATIAEVARFQRGVSWSANQEHDEPALGRTPVIRIPNIRDQLDLRDLVYLTGVDETVKSRVTASKGWLLLVGSNGNPSRIGNAVLVEDDDNFLFASFLIGVKPDTRRVRPKFLLLVLESDSVRELLQRTVRGSTGLQNINLPAIASYSFELPTLDEQDEIVAVLDAADRQIRAVEGVLAKLQMVGSGLLTDLMTRGVSLTGELRPRRRDAPDLYVSQAGESWPSDWNRSPLDDVATRGSGHTPSKGVPSFWNGGVKWVSLADSTRLDQLYISDTDKEISDLGIANSSAVKHPAGTVILSRDAGVGKSAVLSQEMAVSQHFMAWRCGPNLDNIFLYYWLQYMKPAFERIALGSTIQTIGLAFFRRLMISLPPLDEQKSIASRLLAADEAISGASAELAGLRMVKEGLATDLLSGVTRLVGSEA